jgi:hypothetical protein
MKQQDLPPPKATPELQKRFSKNNASPQRKSDWILDNAFNEEMNRDPTLPGTTSLGET